MMVLAGPGSGKTRVITERVRYMVQEKGIDPARILVITFTKAAAMEMKQRYEQIAPAHSGPVQFGTFHAIFFTILRHAYHYNAGQIIRDDLRQQILRELVGDTALDIQDENEFIRDLSSEISRVKGERMDLDHYYSPLCQADVFRRLYEGYQAELQNRRLLDFDDMLVYTYELFVARPDILSAWQRQYPYILVDEYQDINRVQFEVVCMLARPGNNLFVVGDDDQSIYGFRGSRPDIMQSFVRQFQPEICRLGINYRCSGAVVEASSRVIRHNKNRLDKVLSAQADRGEEVCVRRFQGVREENEEIRQQIVRYREQGIPYREMAVLFRTNTQARAITAKLKEYNIPFIMKEMVPNLYDHWIAQDILAYVRVALGDRDRTSVMRIINKPTRYVHRNAFTDPYVDFEEMKLFYEDKNWMVERIEALQQDLKMVAGMRPYAAVNFIRRGVGYDDYIKDYAQYRGARSDDMLEILDEMQEASKGYQSFDEWFEAIISYGEELKEQMEKSRQVRSGKASGEDAVAIMTMHGSKGLEYTCVFLPDANEGITPHNKAVLTEDVEEERRLFYVAMTRAKRHLFISYVKERFNKEVTVSRFVEELKVSTEES